MESIRAFPGEGFPSKDPQAPPVHGETVAKDSVFLAGAHVDLRSCVEASLKLTNVLEATMLLVPSTVNWGNSGSTG